jgi:hypothetical protein
MALALSIILLHLEELESEKLILICSNRFQLFITLLLPVNMNGAHAAEL